MGEKSLEIIFARITTSGNHGKMHAKQFRKLLNVAYKSKASFEGVRASLYNAIQRVRDYPEHVRIIDYRSDTFSKPSREMRQVMYEAPVGDDVYGEDPTVNELEKKSAGLMGKESALFVPSGTMANLLALMVHTERRGCEIIVGDDSHILMWEQAGAAQIAGAQLRSVKNLPNGTFDLQDMLQVVRSDKIQFMPRTSLVCVENTHNNCGGRIIPIDWLRQLSAVLKDLKIPLHLDGARFFNSVVGSGVEPKEIVKDCDSINVCLSKGLGAPIGSLLIGSEEFIKKARTVRKVLGGGMRQVGLMAAAGIYALDNMVERLRDDHNHAKALAKAIHDTGSKIVTADVEATETNILLVTLDTRVVNSEEFCNRLAEVTDSELKEDVVAAIKILPWSENKARLVVCCNNNNDELLPAIKKFQLVIWEYDHKP